MKIPRNPRDFDDKPVAEARGYNNTLKIRWRQQMNRLAPPVLEALADVDTADAAAGSGPATGAGVTGADAARGTRLRHGHCVTKRNYLEISKVTEVADI
jgi:hypothetical protein